MLPLTSLKPKALMPVVNKPLIGRIIEYLKQYGITKVIVNAHHRHAQMLEYLGRGEAFGLEIEVRVESEILGTGGGIRNTEDFWDREPFLVINGDVLTNINLKKAYEYHESSGALVTMVLHDRAPFNQVKVNQDLRIVDIGRKNVPGGLAFTGIHIIDPDVLKNIPKGVFSDIIGCYRDLIQSAKPVRAYISKGHYWFDVGTIESYFAANRELMKEPFAIGPGCSIGTGVRLEEWAVVGEGASLQDNVGIKRSILWEDVSVQEGTKIVDSIITCSKLVDRDVIGGIY